MKFLRITDENEIRVAINLNHIIEVREIDDRNSEIVTTKGVYKYPHWIDDIVTFIEQLSVN